MKANEEVSTSKTDLKKSQDRLQHAQGEVRKKRAELKKTESTYNKDKVRHRRWRSADYGIRNHRRPFLYHLFSIILSSAWKYIKTRHETYSMNSRLKRDKKQLQLYLPMDTGFGGQPEHVFGESGGRDESSRRRRGHRRVSGPRKTQFDERDSRSQWQRRQHLSPIPGSVVPIHQTVG